MLTDDQAAFIQNGRISITAASRDARRLPSVVRAAACRLGPGGRLTLLLATRQSAQVLADITATGAIAVVFSEPSTHRTLQFKGSDARVDAPQPGDAALARAHREAFVEEILPLGYSRDFALTVHSVPGDELSAVTFTVAQVFEQTPGPRAGAKVTP